MFNDNKKQMNNFKQIPILRDGYLIDEYGNIYSEISGKILSQYKESRGYMTIKIDGKNYHIHRLMAATYLGHVGGGYRVVVDHVNGVKDDNRLENLQIISNRDNPFKEKKTSSKYTGVSKFKDKWRSCIRINGVLKYLGDFKNEEDARDAYLDARSYLNE